MKNPVRWAAITVLCGVLLTLLYAGLATRSPVELDSGYRVMMGTFARVVVLAETETAAEACLQAALDEQRRIDSLMSYHREDSELNKINREAYGQPVEVSEATFRVLQEALRFSELSSGAFDITVGPLVDLWRAAGDANTPPSDAAVADARQKVGHEKLILDKNKRTVRFAVGGMKLDLGGIAKGYAIDKSIEAIKRHGALGGMVDIGGDIRCFGRPPRGQTHWFIGLQDPRDGSDDLGATQPLLVLKLSAAAVTTSGDYRRFTTVAGQKQSHIINVQTARGADTLASVTIIAKDATSADALATAVSVLGRRKGLDLIERLPGIEAILIPVAKDATPIFSSGARAYAR
jgi:thiamine biosynthesis lipoprotein